MDMVVFATMSFYDIMTLFKVGNVRMVHGGNLNSAWQAPEWRKAGTRMVHYYKGYAIYKTGVRI